MYCFSCLVELNDLGSWRHYTFDHRRNALCPLGWALAAGVRHMSRNPRTLEGRAELLPRVSVVAQSFRLAGSRLCKDAHSPRGGLV
jgi:hypothetical protein